MSTTVVTIGNFDGVHAGHAALVRRAAEVLRERAEELARLMTLEMGKPIGEARAEIGKCAWVCEYYADAGPGFLADEPVDSDAARSLVAWQPLGTVLAVMPWNFPFWQVFRFAAPALVAGNAVVLKHAAQTLLAGERFQAACDKAAQKMNAILRNER